jgi:hypothetical protein
MFAFVLPVIAVVGIILLAGTRVAAAIPADGASIARLGHQIAPAVSVKTSKPKTATRTTGTSTPRPSRQPSETY